jgi:hypothetical protein
MPEVKSAADAEAIIRSYYLQVAGPHPYSFRTSQNGSEWVVTSTFRTSTEAESEEHEWRIDSETGRVWFRKLNSVGDEELKQRFFRPRDESQGEATAQPPRPPDAKSVIAENAPDGQQSAEGKTADYRAAAKQIVQSEILDLMKEEVRNAARELVAEQTKAIGETVVQHKRFIREALEEEKAAARRRIEEVRQTMRFLASLQVPSGSPEGERAETRQGA